MPNIVISAFKSSKFLQNGKPINPVYEPFGNSVSLVGMEITYYISKVSSSCKGLTQIGIKDIFYFKFKSLFMDRFLAPQLDFILLNGVPTIYYEYLTCYIACFI